MLVFVVRGVHSWWSAGNGPSTNLFIPIATHTLPTIEGCNYRNVSKLLKTVPQCSDVVNACLHSVLSNTHTHTHTHTHSKLINRSVPNTVDLRALTRISPTASSSERTEALQENMTLTTESARAIGCRVTESTGESILAKDPATIRTFLVDLIRVREAGNRGRGEISSVIPL